MKRLALGSVFLLFTSVLYSQRAAKNEYSEIANAWQNGTVYVDEKALSGQLRFNYFEGILHLKLDQENVKTYHAGNIQRFEMEEPDGYSRQFISAMLKNDPNNGRYFFEVLVECKRFALLRTETAYAYQRNGGGVGLAAGTMPIVSSNKMTTVVKQRNYYIFDDAGNTSLYLVVENKNNDSVIINTSSKRFVVDKKLLPKYMGKLYTDVENQAKNSGLRFSDENDLIEICEIYKELEQSF